MRLPDNFLGFKGQHVLRGAIPALDISIRIEHHDGIIGNPID